MQASPLQQIMDRFGDDDGSTEARRDAKEALVKAVTAHVKSGLLDDEFSDKGMERVSNKKLLKLLSLAETVEEEFGSKAALIDRCLELEGRTKDADYRSHLESYRLPALYSYYEAARKRAR